MKVYTRCGILAFFRWVDDEKKRVLKFNLKGPGAVIIKESHGWTSEEIQQKIR